MKSVVGRGSGPLAMSKRNCFEVFGSSSAAPKTSEIKRPIWGLLALTALSALAGCNDDGLVPLSGSGGPSTSAAARPTVNLQVSPSSVTAGQKVTLQWNASGSQSCMASGGWSGAQPMSGTLSLVTPPESTSYTLTCTGQGGSAAQSAAVTVHPAAPSVTLTATPTTVDAQGVATLHWLATNANACTASGGWQGPLSTTGQWSTGKLSNTTEFEITCTGSGGTTTQSTTVTVSASAPAIMIQANPSTVSPGGSSVLTWSGRNVTSCSASGGWSGNQSASGTQATGPLEATSTFTLTCQGPGGSATQSAMVSVAAGAPSIVLSANPSTVTQGASSTLSWSANDATACSASGAWSGNKGVKGTQSVGPLNTSGTYTLSCSGPGGTAMQSATVSVKSPPPTVTLSVGPSAIASGGSATLTWSSKNATACSAAGGWSGSKALSGTQSTGALTSTATYTLTCTGGGGSAAQSATVSVKPPAPTVHLTASPSSITSGGSATLSWTSLNATSCTASGAWAGTEGLSGSQSTGALSTTKTYVLTCAGAGGSAVQSAIVTVTPQPAATVQLSATPSTVASGSASTLSWSTTNASACTASGAWSGSKATSGSQSTGALSANSTFTLTCTGGGSSASQSTTVSVTQPAPTVSLSASPSTVTSGGSVTLTWSSRNATACSASNGWSGSKSVSGSQSSGALKANTTFTLTCSGTGGSATQSASVSVSSPAPAPTVSLLASPSTVANGSSSTLSWSSTNATSCAASGAWSGNQALSGSYSTGALKASATYVLTCSGTGGSAAQSATVTVTTPAPTVTLTASPSSVASGGSSTLSWSSTNAASCTAAGAWTGTKATSGSQSTGGLSASSTYTLTCQGAGGSAAQSTTVSVTAPAPSVTLSATPTTVKSGGTSMLKWSSVNATTCMASAGWSGNEATSGSASTAAITAATKYMLTCSGTGGSASQSVTVSISTPAPTLSLSASPSSVSSGGASTLTWSSTNATSCTASGGWSGTVASSGSKSTGALSSSTSYTLSCTGSGGSASQTATVSVSPSSGGVQRPSYNTGDGFFVYNGKLYDANGNEFRIRGVNRCHFDSDSQPGISHSKANAVRIFMYQLSLGAAKYANVIQTQHIDYQEVPILAMPMFPDNTLSSGNQSTSELSAGVAWWVANAQTFAPLSKYLIINIANEWGPSNSTVWRDSYISAITQMRAAGYSGPLLIDSGGYGQDPDDILNYGAAVVSNSGLRRRT